jgi:hypothetical protein
MLKHCSVVLRYQTHFTLSSATGEFMVIPAEFIGYVLALRPF